MRRDELLTALGVVCVGLGAGALVAVLLVLTVVG